MTKVALITTSTRPGRVAPKVAAWIKAVLQSANKSDVEITNIDVADYKLPLFDENVLPAMVPHYGNWTKPYAKAWSEEIAKYDGYVLLGNEYNFGMSSSTKNAIDYLYHAWISKPILIVTYGIMGGNSASEQLKAVLTGMKTKVIETRPQLAFQGPPTGEDVTATFGGVLTDTNKALWEKEKKGDVLKGWEELIAAVEEKKKEGQGVEQ